MTYRRLLPAPSIWLPFVNVMLLQCGISFTEAMLEPHGRRDVGMNGRQVEAAFFIYGATYTVFSPLLGLVGVGNGSAANSRIS